MVYAPQSLSEEWAPVLSLFKRRSKPADTTASGSSPAHDASTVPRDAYAGHGSPADSTQRSEGQTSDDDATSLGKDESDANLAEKPLPPHEQGMQAPGAVHLQKTTSPSDMENGLVRADTQDSLAAVRTISRVPGNTTYYEKGGLRTYGDGQDHIHEPKMTFRRFMIFVAMGFLWTGSQIPLYLFGGIIPLIEEDIGGADRYVWIALGNLIPLATVTPFVGALSDLFGRRNIAMLAALLGLLGSIVCSTSHDMNVFIGGQVLIGIGAGIGELTALAVAGESAPTKKRGIYIGGIIITIIPYCPSVLFAQLVAQHGSWRYVGLWTGLWNFIGLTLTAIFYWPPARANRGGLSKWDIAKRIDYIGGILSAGGLTLFLAGLTWAGNQYPWDSPHVLASIILGAILCILFLVWEIWFVKYPIFPGRLKQNPRALYVICFITFVSGANFFAVLVFWPTQYFVMYSGESAYPSPVEVGLGSLPVGFCIIGGSIIFSVLVTVLKGKVRTLMVLSCIIMTAGNGAMAAANLDNLSGVYAAVTFACLGVGAVIVPNQIIASIICPDDLIATITALTISVRIIGGAIGYAAYYHILRTKFTDAVFIYLAPVVIDAGVLNPIEFGEIALALGGNLRSSVPYFPAIDTPEKVAAVIHAGEQCFAYAYPQVYYVSIAFGGAAIIAAFFLPDITKFMDGHIAVQYTNMH